MRLEDIKNNIDSLYESKLKFTFVSIGKNFLKLGLLILTLLGQLVIKLLFGFRKLVNGYPMAVVIPILLGWSITYIVMSWNYHSLQDRMEKEMFSLQDSIEAAKISGQAEGYRIRELEDMSNANRKVKETKVKAVQPKKIETPKVEKDPMEEVKVEPVKIEESNKIE